MMTLLYVGIGVGALTLVALLIGFRIEANAMTIRAERDEALTRIAAEQKRINNMIERVTPETYDEVLAAINQHEEDSQSIGLYAWPTQYMRTRLRGRMSAFHREKAMYG